MQLYNHAVLRSDELKTKIDFQMAIESFIDGITGIWLGLSLRCRALVIFLKTINSVWYREKWIKQKRLYLFMNFIENIYYEYSPARLWHNKAYANFNEAQSFQYFLNTIYQQIFSIQIAHSILYCKKRHFNSLNLWKFFALFEKNKHEFFRIAIE